MRKKVAESSNLSTAQSCTRMSGLVLLCVLLVTPGVTGFKLDQDKDSQSHWEITEAAILNVTARACRTLAREEDRDFTLPATLTPQSLLEACAAKSSAGKFARYKFEIKGCNSLVNTEEAQTASAHFDNESFDKGKKTITDGLYTVKASIKREDYEAARCQLGRILHTLQDFYSHSNWIEMGNDQPNTNLIKADVSLGNKADGSRPTCRNCTDNCTDNILEDINKEKLLTSGYFSPWPQNNKPTGKCSHGDNKDNTRHSEATGGINKDGVNSSHGYLHKKAAEVSRAATVELLEDVQDAVGHKSFLRMMGVSPGKAVCFVIDTTGSMGYDILAVQYISNNLIKDLVGTENEPSVYVLVPFNDPDFGPVKKTTDITEFQSAINSLSPSGGGDEPEFSLSGLQLALNAVPVGSEIYLFTDATVKDTNLKDSVITGIKRTQCLVFFLISEDTLVEPIYDEMAKVSGGQVVKLTKDKVFPAINLFLNSSFSNMVTLLHAVRSPGKIENFTFSVDESETRLSVFITGTKAFTLISPSGAVQETITGPLTTSSETVGNLLVLTLNHEAGLWKINMRSTEPYTLNIKAQSSVSFFISFMESSEVRSDGYSVKTNQPTAEHSGTLMVVPFGKDAITLKEVNLVYSSTSGQSRGNITGQENNEYLVQFDKIPSEGFTVQVKLEENSGLTKSTSPSYQRQSTANNKPLLISVTTSSPATVEPGSTIYTTITVSTLETEGNFTIKATLTPDVGSINSSFTLEVLRNSSANAIIQSTIANTTTFGTEVKQTVEVKGLSASDSTYAVSTFTVTKEVTDIYAPVFDPLTPQAYCLNICNSTWQFSVRVTDDTLLANIYVREGNGTLQLNKASDNNTVVSYNASCCFPTVEVVAVDEYYYTKSCNRQSTRHNPRQPHLSSNSLSTQHKPRQPQLQATAIQHDTTLDNHNYTATAIQHYTTLDNHNYTATAIQHDTIVNNHNYTATAIQHDTIVNNHNYTATAIQHDTTLDNHSYTPTAIQHDTTLDNHNYTATAIQHDPTLDNHNYTATAIQHDTILDNHNYTATAIQNDPTLDNHNYTATAIQHDPTLDNHNYTATAIQHDTTLDNHNYTATAIQHDTTLDNHNYTATAIQHDTTLDNHNFSATAIQHGTNLNSHNYTATANHHDTNLDNHNYRAITVTHNILT
ncbi:hypothetical protein WMY93_008050 [Mugilogobius chulae]|uniref:VWFA domain-containing protein n=1 Tax=Mugilogobius chulae TaxID=88201 RepID=A0AAW0PNP2_9GOBI